MMSSEKRCSGCGETKPVGEFSRNRSRRDGLQEWCKRCKAVQRRQHYAANRERELAQRRSHYAANRERELDRMRSWRAANPEKAAAATRSWRAANPEKVAAATHAWRKAHAEEVTAAARVRDKAAHEAGREYLDELKRATGCQDCGARPDDLSELHFHHLDPATKVACVGTMITRSRATLDAEIAKCVLVCQPCHAERHRLMRQERVA